MHSCVDVAIVGAMSGRRRGPIADADVLDAIETNSNPPIPRTVAWTRHSSGPSRRSRIKWADRIAMVTCDVCASDE